jgi:hypothetical protein
MEETGRWERKIKFSKLNQALARCNGFFTTPDTRDKLGRGMMYLYPSRMPKPDQYTLEDYYDFAVYFFQQNVKLPLSWHRHGTTYIEDLTGFKMSHMDSRIGSKTQKIFQNNFPARIQSILIVDPPAKGLVKALLKIARLFMKKKIIDRVKIISRKELLEHVDEDQLLEHFGGTYQFDENEELEKYK